MDGKDKALRWPRGLLGAIGGALLGYFAFMWIARQGFYALALPGAAMGLGCGTLSRGRSLALGIVCGVLALVLGVFAEWRFAPFVDDPGLGFFLMHLGDLMPITQFMIVAGAVFALWFGMGREGGAWNQGKSDAL